MLVELLRLLEPPGQPGQPAVSRSAKSPGPTRGKTDSSAAATSHERCWGDHQLSTPKNVKKKVLMNLYELEEQGGSEHIFHRKPARLTLANLA